jgi:hypothetical protein
MGGVLDPRTMTKPTLPPGLDAAWTVPVPSVEMGPVRPSNFSRSAYICG